jgi:uncharacterized protein with PIN domain
LSLLANRSRCTTRRKTRGFRLTGLDGRRLWRDEYGFDWLVVEADSAGEARIAAVAYGERRHPAQVDMELFAAAYRAGAVSLMQRTDGVS